MEERDNYVSNETQSNRNLLTLKYPIERGIITNWEDMEKIWIYIFNTLNATPAEHNVLLSECVLNPEPNRENMTEVIILLNS